MDTDTSTDKDPISVEEAQVDEYDPDLDGDDTAVAGSQPTGKP